MINIAVIGLGYVGLPLYCLLSKKYLCKGFDLDTERVQQLREGKDAHNIVPFSNIKETIRKNSVTTNWNDIKDCNFYIVTVPTPIDDNKHPDTSSLENVCYNIGNQLNKNDIVVFESTVYPGATEDLCVPILENTSGLSYIRDFTVGYSPERINIGDNNHSIENTPKIISATNDITLNVICDVYSAVLKGNIVKASSIKVAEAAKMYENVQRDVLIALANQFSDYCRTEDIDVNEVTQCASTKWNFANVKPGLVGGHCIGVDPYYLLERASKKGVHLQLVEMARQVNERKAEQVAQKILEMGKAICGDQKVPDILLLGFSYKSNTNDIRNTKVADVVKRLQGKCNLDCYDPLVDSKLVFSSYGIYLCTLESIIGRHYDLSVLMVPHKVLSNLDIESTVHIDLKDIL